MDENNEEWVLLVRKGSKQRKKRDAFEEMRRNLREATQHLSVIKSFDPEDLFPNIGDRVKDVAGKKIRKRKRDK